MIVAALAMLGAAVVLLVVGAVAGADGLPLVWAAAVAAPLSLLPMWLGLRRMRPPRGGQPPAPTRAARSNGWRR